MPHNKSLTSFLEEEDTLIIVPARLTLHGIFWFHTSVQSRGKYVHISAPVIHNYPLTLAFLGRPVEASYANISGLIEPSITPEQVWRERGFYVYPAIAEKLLSRTLLFSMGGTGYAIMKLQTRASVPDLAVNQVYLPGSKFKTFILLKSYSSLPKARVIRLGAKRYGVFQVKYERPRRVTVKAAGDKPVTHPFNERDTALSSSRSILRHYMGNIAIFGYPDRVIVLDDVVLAAPKFI